MTSGEITDTLLRDRWRQTKCIPRYTPEGWFECDVAEFTSAGYLREYEIKISRADFLNDAKKVIDVSWRKGDGSGTLKHDLLKEKSPRGPVQFWFVAPEGLIRLNEVPEWAGLIEIVRRPNSNHLSEVERIKAPRLHNEKPAPDISLHATGVCYWRYHGALSTLTTLRRESVKQMKLLRAFGWPKIRPKKISP